MGPTESQYDFDEEVEQHHADLYRTSSTADGVENFDAVNESHISRYREQGFLAIRHAFDPAEVRAAVEGLTDLVAGANPEFKNIQFRGGVRDALPSLSLDEKMNSVRKLMTFTDYEPRLKAVAEHPRLLNLVARLMDGARPELFQSMALLKPPRGREKPWHQDHAYFDLPLETKVVGVWIALDAADEENGCMRVIPGWHRRGPFTHFQRRDWQICDDQMNREPVPKVAVPLEPGGCLLFDSFLPHGTPSNTSARRRAALQFHYCPADTARTEARHRLDVFGSEGKNVSC